RLRSRPTAPRSAREAVDRVRVAGIPQHPSIRAERLGRRDLGSDLVATEGPTVERVIPERLKPWPEAGRGQPAPLPRLLEREEYDLVRVSHGIAIARNAELERRRVEHRRDVVEQRREVLDALA